MTVIMSPILTDGFISNSILWGITLSQRLQQELASYYLPLVDKVPEKTTQEERESERESWLALLTQQWAAAPMLDKLSYQA